MVFKIIKIIAWVIAYFAVGYIVTGILSRIDPDNPLELDYEDELWIVVLVHPVILFALLSKIIHRLSTEYLIKPCMEIGKKLCEKIRRANK